MCIIYRVRVCVLMQFSSVLVLMFWAVLLFFASRLKNLSLCTALFSFRWLVTLVGRQSYLIFIKMPQKYENRKSLSSQRTIAVFLSLLLQKKTLQLNHSFFFSLLYFCCLLCVVEFNAHHFEWEKSEWMRFARQTHTNKHDQKPRRQKPSTFRLFWHEIVVWESIPCLCCSTRF